jgi:hypothetical protein
MSEDYNFSDFFDVRQTYKNNVDKINLDMKKKYFDANIINNSNKNLLKISCLDDTFNILYKNKRKYELSNLDVNFNYTNNIYDDIIRLCKIIFGTKYFDDNDFKYVRYHNDLNYFNPKNNESIIYNSILKNVFQQSDFRTDLYKFEEKLKNIMEYYGKQDIKINFFEDEEYTPIIWLIIEIKN